MSRGHLCQFFDFDETRADAVAAFVAEGLRDGERVMTVVRPVHWAAIMTRLASMQIDAEREIHRGSLIVMDAMDTLRRVTRDGVPDRTAFDDCVGAAVRGLAELGPIRAYGEMVDILAQRGDLHDALALEGLWNDLMQTTPILLMCGYSATHFVAMPTHRVLRQICFAHSDVRRSEADPLANWILTAAHNPISPSSTLSH